ncbi:MAG: HAD-IIA family hydrolase [Clostridiaceae bacterium]|jgi:HAD superfamily hydrolase (TIGR01450 family)|nr:HAD-IIA family hydrolase [Clostridiaceae bacterium]
MTNANQDPTNRLSQIKCWLLDMDGTITLGEEALPGAAPFFASIREQEHIFLTNNSSHARSHYLARLGRIGIPASPEQILTSTDAMALYLKTIGPAARPVRIYPVGTPGFEQDLLAAGIELEKEREKEIDFVVLAFDTSLVYEKLDVACDYIRRGIPYLATNPDLVCPLAGGRVLPDCGALIAYMQTCTGIDPQKVIGKPQTAMIDMVLASRPFRQEELAMVGDRIYTDIASARNAGILSIAVLSGEATREDLEQASVKPDLIFADVGELADCLEKQRAAGRPS